MTAQKRFRVESRAPKRIKGHPLGTVLTDGDYEKAAVMAGLGLTRPQIAAVLGMAPRTLNDRKNGDPRLAAALDRGKADAAIQVGQALFRRARAGDVNAIRWWEMTRLGMSERRHHEVQEVPKLTIEFEPSSESEALLEGEDELDEYEDE